MGRYDNLQEWVTARLSSGLPALYEQLGNTLTHLAESARWLEWCGEHERALKERLVWRGCAHPEPCRCDVGMGYDMRAVRELMMEHGKTKLAS